MAFQEEPVVLDRGRLEILREFGGLSMAVSMLDLFLEGAAARYQAACDALRGADLPGAERALHSLASSAGNVGCRRLAALARNLESLVTQGEVEAAVPLLAELGRRLGEAVQALEGERRALEGDGP